LELNIPCVTYLVTPSIVVFEAAMR